MPQRAVLTLTALLLLTAGPWNPTGTGPDAPCPAGGARLPACPHGWRLDVVAAAPKVRHPSVVCCAPDGRVFVAEDPMDISAPRADLALGRILCLHPDGKVTLFADKLYAVFGMQYLDGQLYVLHNPRFSRFTDDDGVGKDRLDLIESTNPNPWALDWNDHVPANFRLAMDGFLYVAVGDKGIYGAVGRDGKRVDLHGGGVLRLRPDGTGLEVFCSGVRNILDVALDAEDEVFTYDNTDEQQWMSRLTHMVDGGFYGYPYDFLPRRPYTLWMMADYGGGAATGTFCYTEDALPPEYHGDLFLADFGKRQLLRVKARRAGATYEAVSRQDFFADPPGDFRPVGIALAPDGTSIYLCDWNHADTKDKVEVGRLLKLSYTGTSQAARKPTWYLPAALGKPFRATLEELLGGLSHPAQSVRLVAQRRLAERGAAAVPAVTELLKDTKAPNFARWHALWALDAIDQGQAARPAILAAAGDADAGLRRQAARQLGTRRVREAAAVLRAGLKDPDAGVRFHAAAALGRLGDRTAVPALLDALDEADFFTRYAVFTALNRIGRADAAAWPAIADGLEHPRPAVRDGVQLALRETYEEPLVETLARLARDADRPSEARAAAVRLLASVHRRTPAWKGEWWAYHPVNASPPGKTVAWPATATILGVLRQGVADAQAPVRQASVEGLRQAKDTDSAKRLREQLQREADGGVRGSILAALGTFRDREAGGLIRTLLQNPKQHAALLPEAIAAAEQIGGEDVTVGLTELLHSKPLDQPALLQTIRALGAVKGAAAVALLQARAREGNAEVRQAALDALVRIGGDAGLAALVALADEPSVETRRGAAAALGELGVKAALPRLLKAYPDPETRPAAIAALTQIPDIQALEPYLSGLEDRSHELRARCQKALGRIREEALRPIEEKVDRLSPVVVAQLQQVYRDHDAARRGKLFAVAVKAPAQADYLEFVRSNPGDARRGKDLFQDPAALACAKCHKVNGAGGEIGPDLSTIGAQFDRVQLAESILYPSKSIREGYQQVVVTTKDGKVVAGLLRSESSEALTLRDAEGKDHTVRKSDMEGRRTGQTSLMPEGMHAGLPLQDFADLVSFLQSLRGRTEGRR